MKGDYYSCYIIFPVLVSVRYFMCPVDWRRKLWVIPCKNDTTFCKAKLHLRRRYPYVINRIRRKSTDRKRWVYLLYKNSRIYLANRKLNEIILYWASWEMPFCSCSLQRSLYSCKDKETFDRFFSACFTILQFSQTWMSIDSKACLIFLFFFLELEGKNLSTCACMCVLLCMRLY